MWHENGGDSNGSVSESVNVKLFHPWTDSDTNTNIIKYLRERGDQEQSVIEKSVESTVREGVQVEVRGRVNCIVHQKQL